MEHRSDLDILIHEKIFNLSEAVVPEPYTTSLDSAYRIIDAGRGGLEIINGACMFIDIEVAPACYYVRVEAFTVGDGTPNRFQLIASDLKVLPLRICEASLHAAGLMKVVKLQTWVF